VLVKAVAVPTNETDPGSDAKRTLLIENISAATNSQTIVTIADRVSGDPLNLKLQDRLFQEYGILYERKRGEFAEGVRDGYIRPEDVVGRTKFARVYLTANGSISRAQKRRITVQHLGHDVASNDAKLENAVIGLDAFKIIAHGRLVHSQRSYLVVLPQIRAAVVASSHFGCELKDKGLAGAEVVNRTWAAFLRFAAQRRPKMVNKVTELDSDIARLVLKPGKSGYGIGLEELINEFFSNPANLFDGV
jgi:AIPR protein